MPISASDFTGGQLTFASTVASITGLDAGVIAAWCYQEENGSAAQSRQQQGNNDWLNIGYTDSATYGSSDSIWGSPENAAKATAGWLQGQDTIPGYGTASNGIQGILRSAGKSAQAQISAIQGSGWATSGEPELPAIYSELDPALLRQLGSGVSSLTGGVLGLGGTGTKSNDLSNSNFTVGDTSNPTEDYWTAINRLAQDRQWYCLALDTPVPTPTGWKTIGSLSVGDQVFNTDGEPIFVLSVTPTYRNRDCFRVEFKDGTSIVADADHLWRTSSLYKSGVGLVREARDRWVGLRTTRELSETVERKGYKVYNHQIALSKSLQLPEADLPIDPYVFGYWLGDGSKVRPILTVGDVDRKHVEDELHRAGYLVSSVGSYEAGTSHLYFTTGVRGELTKALRTLGVYNNKHIPICYLRSSEEQRTALLQGLMDSDGAMGIMRTTFSNVNTRLAADFRELVRSLGMRSYVGVVKGGKSIRMPRGHVSVSRDCVIVGFPFSSILPFRLKRKADAYVEARSARKAKHNEVHTVTSVEPVDSVPVACVEVDSEDSMFLVGESMIPTHNCFGDGESLYLADGPHLIAQTPAVVLDRVKDAGRILSLSFDWDNSAFTSAIERKHRNRIERRTALAKIQSPTEAELELICEIDAIRGGDVIYLTSCGPGDGVWLVGDVTRSVFSISSQITLVPAIAPLTEQEAAGSGAANSSKSSTLGDSLGSGTVIQLMIARANQINEAKYPYAYGGGHPQAGVPSQGTSSESGGPIVTGFDCSGCVTAVLKAGGLWTEASVGNDASVISTLLQQGKITAGRGSGTPECTLYDNSGVHIFMSLNGQFFGTSDGGGGPTNTTSAGLGGGGGTWLTSGPDVQTFTPYHFSSAELSKVIGGSSSSSSTSSGSVSSATQDPSSSRMQLPSNCYGAIRNSSQIVLIVLHDSEIAGGSGYFSSLFSSLTSGRRIGSNPTWDPAGTGLSVHCGVNTDGTVTRFIDDVDLAYGAVDANPVALQVEQAGFASQDSWPDAQIEATAKLVAFWSGKFNIPLELPSDLSYSAVTSGQASGVCQHKDLGAAGGGHSDCGPAYPFQRVLELAKSM